MTPELSIRPATPDDARFVWTVNNDPEVRAQSIHTEPIPWETHVGWFERALRDGARRLYLACLDGAPAGVIRFDLEDRVATISVALGAAFRGRGVGTLTIRRGCEEIARERVVTRVNAFVRPTNPASLAAFERAGFRHSGERATSNGVELDLMIREFSDE